MTVTKTLKDIFINSQKTSPFWLLEPLSHALYLVDIARKFFAARRTKNIGTTSVLAEIKVSASKIEYSFRREFVLLMC